MEITSQNEPETAWKATSWRFSAFVSDIMIKLDGASEFKKFFELDHEDQTHRASEMSDRFSVLGPVQGFEVMCTPGKIDFIVRAPANVEIDDADAVLKLGDCTERLQIFRESVLKFLSARTDLRRIAVGAELFQEVRSKFAGYKLLESRLMSVKLHPETSSEFGYQINIPRRVDLGGNTVEINRYMQWSCAKAVFTIELNKGESKTVNRNHARVVTDVNSDDSFDVSKLSQTNLLDLSTTLFDYTAEIARKGECE